MIGLDPICLKENKVCINGFESETKIMHHGVPQGSVLGLLICTNVLTTLLPFILLMIQIS